MYRLTDPKKFISDAYGAASDTFSSYWDPTAYQEQKRLERNARWRAAYYARNPERATKRVSYPPSQPSAEYAPPSSPRSHLEVPPLLEEQYLPEVPSGPIRISPPLPEVPSGPIRISPQPLPELQPLPEVPSGRVHYIIEAAHPTLIESHNIDLDDKYKYELCRSLLENEWKWFPLEIGKIGEENYLINPRRDNYFNIDREIAFRTWLIAQNNNGFKYIKLITGKDTYFPKPLPENEFENFIRSTTDVEYFWNIYVDGRFNGILKQENYLNFIHFVTYARGWDKVKKKNRMGGEKFFNKHSLIRTDRPRDSQQQFVYQLSYMLFKFAHTLRDIVEFKETTEPIVGGFMKLQRKSKRKSKKRKSKKNTKRKHKRKSKKNTKRKSKRKSKRKIIV